MTRKESAKPGNQSIESTTKEIFKKHVLTEFKSKWEKKRRRNEVEYSIVVFQSFKHQKKMLPLQPHPGSLSSPALTNHMAPKFPYEAPKDGHKFSRLEYSAHLCKPASTSPSEPYCTPCRRYISGYVYKYAKNTDNWSTHHRHHMLCKRFFLSRFESHLHVNSCREKINGLIMHPSC